MQLETEIGAADILHMPGDECPLLWSMVHMQVKGVGEEEGSDMARRWYRDFMEGECGATISGRYMLGFFQYSGFIPTASAYGHLPSPAGPRRAFRQYRQD